MPLSCGSGLTPAAQKTPLGFSFTNIAPQAGLTARTVYGGKDTNKYLLETTGTGVAAIDYDADGWLDIFLVNGTTLEGFPKGQEPTNHLYRNRGNGTFEDVTARAGLAASGWGQGACVGDYDNDGRDDLFVTYWGQNRLYRNKGDGTFDDVTRRAGLVRGPCPLGHRLRVPRLRPRRTARSDRRQLHRSRSGRDAAALVRAVPIQRAGRRVRTTGAARRQERPLSQSRRRHVRRRLGGVRHHSRQGHLRARRGHARLRRRRLGGCLRRERFEPERAVPQQPRRHVHRHRHHRPAAPTARTASRRPAWGSRSATTIATARWTSSRRTLPATRRRCTRTPARALCEDRTFASGFGLNTRWLGWGVGFLDLDSDGWLDLFLVNGHVYPEVASSRPKRATSSGRSCIATCATAASPT